MFEPLTRAVLHRFLDLSHVRVQVGLDLPWCRSQEREQHGLQR